MAAKTEIEVKIKLSGTSDAAALVRKLKRLGAKAESKPFLEHNELFDWPDQRLRRAKRLLRVRATTRPKPAYSGRLTFKGPQQGSRTMKRLEVETHVDDVRTARAILEALGMIKWWAYDGKRRRFWLHGGRVEVSLDHMPVLGWFFEIEAPTAFILDTIAKKLGYSKRDYIVKSYLALAKEKAERDGKPLRDLVF